MFLLLGLNELIIQKNPQLIIGYNILNFDIPYMIARAKFNLCIFNSCAALAIFFNLCACFRMFLACS